MQQFVKSGEKLLFPSTELSVLKDHLKKAKQWIQRVQDVAAGDATTAADAMITLLPEAQNINVDLSELIDNMQQATTVYCVCRLPFHGLMLCCDTCEEWYHTPCFGISKAQADRIDKYICIRCTLKQSFAKAANAAADGINMWVDPDAAIELLDQRRLMVSW